LGGKKKDWFLTTELSPIVSHDVSDKTGGVVVKIGMPHNLKHVLTSVGTIFANNGILQFKFSRFLPYFLPNKELLVSWTWCKIFLGNNSLPKEDVG
jgi:hypothetical protein